MQPHMKKNCFKKRPTTASDGPHRPQKSAQASGICFEGTDEEDNSATAERRTANVVVGVDVGPPAARYEDAPARQGYVYTPGCYQWDEGRREHVWVGVSISQRGT